MTLLVDPAAPGRSTRSGVLRAGASPCPTLMTLSGHSMAVMDEDNRASIIRSMPLSINLRSDDAELVGQLERTWCTYSQAEVGARPLKLRVSFRVQFDILGLTRPILGDSGRAVTQAPLRRMIPRSAIAPRLLKKRVDARSIAAAAVLVDAEGQLVAIRTHGELKAA